jgi:hypothetical protein
LSAADAVCERVRIAAAVPVSARIAGRADYDFVGQHRNL